MIIHIVIGKNFGDEGKGLATDFFAMTARKNGHSLVVVRHNGGAQAGHTVNLRDKKFIFHQVSSGSFRFADTYWAGTFLPDLYQLGNEVRGFGVMTGFIPKIFADGNARCATVIDVIMNQMLESRRGDERHGSCGMGIDETVRRSKTPYVIRLEDLCSGSVDEIFGRLVSIRQEYIPERLDQLGLKPSDMGEYEALLNDDVILRNWASKAKENTQYVKIAPPDMLKSYDEVIFEGAQGLLLDEMNKEYAPHLTTSRTGLTNPVDIIRRVMPDEEESAEAVYVTRSYVTRHGNGPLPYEEKRAYFYDETNMPNEWQGTLRFARDPGKEEGLKQVRRDVSENSFKGRVEIFVTHLNEVGTNSYGSRYESYSRYAEEVIVKSDAV